MLSKSYFCISSENVRNRYSRIVVIYTYLCIIYNVFFIITPIRDLIEHSVLIYFSKMLCVVGVFLIAFDLLTERMILKAPEKKWTYLLLSGAAIATIYRYSYDLMGNIKTILWNIVQMTLIYSATLRLSDKEENDLMIRLHSLASAIFIPVLFYMFHQFINLEYYITEKDIHQGWYEGRLFGITNTLYYGTSLAAVLLFGSVFLLIYNKHKVMRLLYFSEIFIYGIYIILSDTRTIFAGMAAGLFVIFTFGDFLHSIAEGWKRTVCRMLLYIILIFMLMMLVRVGRAVMLTATYYHVYIDPDINKFLESESIEELDRPKNRTLSSRRAFIWKSYGEILGADISNIIFGFSPYGYDRYIWENYPDSYVVKDFKDFYPLDYAAFKVYGAHNAYLHVLLTTGITGFIGVLGFILSSAYKFLKYHNSGRCSIKDLFICSIIVMLLSFLFFEVDIFMRTTTMSFVFWLFAGALMKRVNNIGISS